MMKDMLSSISEFIRCSLSSGENVSDEIIYELISEVDEHIKTCSLQKIPPDFFSLSEYVINKVQFGNLYEFSADLVLVYGKLWSVMNMVKIAEGDESLALSIRDDAKQYRKRLGLFRAIRDRSGINHSELAEAIGKSVSHLSQIINEMDSGKYFVSRQFGRSKFYYITNNGKELLSKMEEQENVINLDESFKYLSNSEISETDKTASELSNNGFRVRSKEGLAS